MTSQDLIDTYRHSSPIPEMTTWLKLPVNGYLKNDLTPLRLSVDGWDDRKLGHPAGRCT